MKMMRGLEHLSDEQRLRRVELFSLEKAQGDLISVYRYLVGGLRREAVARPSWRYSPGHGPMQPASGDPAFEQGGGLGDLQRRLPTSAIPCFCNNEWLCVE